MQPIWGHCFPAMALSNYSLGRMTEVEPLSVKVKEAITWFYKWLRLQAEAEPDLEWLDLAKFDKRAMRELITKSESSASHSKRPYGASGASKFPDGGKISRPSMVRRRTG
jgi:hypothetical protein